MLRRAAPHLAFALMAGMLLIQAAHFAGHTTDDAFIAFRYARNIAEGAGPAYNPPARVEGFSDPLWVMLLTLAYRAGLELEMASKLLGLACGLACLALVHYRARSLSERPGSPAWYVAGAWLAASAAFAFWCVGGLETPLYALEVTGLALALHDGRAALAGALGFALAATRPEGALLAAAVLAFALWQRRQGGPWPAWTARYTAIVVPLVAVLFAVRFALFGSLFPHTVAAKWAGGTSPLVGAAGYLYGALVIYLPVPVLILASAAYSFRGSEGPLFALAPWLMVAELIPIVAGGGDWMPLYRLIAPFAPLSALLAAAGLDTVLGLIGPFLSKVDRVAAVAGLAICGLKLFSVPFDEAVHVRDQQRLGRLQDTVGKTLHGRGGRVACGDIGRIGFLSGLEIMDLKGLVSPEALAAFRLSPTSHQMLAGAGWVLDRKAEWLALVTERVLDKTRGFYPPERELYRDPRLEHDYVLDRVVDEPGSPLEYRIFRRRDFTPR